MVNNGLNLSLPLASEVFVKVMFLHLSVSHSLQGGGHVYKGAHFRGMCDMGCAWPKGCMARGKYRIDIHYRGMHSRGMQDKSMCGWAIMCGMGCAWQRGGGVCDGAVLDRGCAW